MLPTKPEGFMNFDRELAKNESRESRLTHYNEFSNSLSPEKLQHQAYRCMDCAVPFCHNGCPLGNSIPDFNDLVKDNDWEQALQVLHSTNNFPEFTGRVCPAPCEGSCVLGINEPPVTIEMIEREIAEHGWQQGFIQPEPPAKRTGKKVAIIGSGPAGLAAAQQLNRAGHEVVVYERDDEPGGLLTYGIPNFKLSKEVVFRRIAQMKAEGITFQCNAEVGKNVPTSDLDNYDVVLIAIGSTVGRHMAKDLPGASLNGVHLAMPFLKQQTRRVLGKTVKEKEILATGKNVVVIGGGDTGSDCIGTSLRQGCASLVNLELMPTPPDARHADNPWPQWPLVFRTSSSHQEGGDRHYSTLTKSFEDDGNGNVVAVNTVKIAWSDPDASGRRNFTEVAGTEESIPADLVLLAMGFTQPEVGTFVKDLDLKMAPNRFGQGIKTDDAFKSSRPNVFVAGDARRGQSLVVWAIHEGREAARAVDLFLIGHSDLDTADSAGYDTQTALAEASATA